MLAGRSIIAGSGIDIISVTRVREIIARSGERFLRRWFSDDEIAYCAAKARPYQHYAARIAAKEASIKALGIAWEKKILFKDVAISNSETGAPCVKLAGEARKIADKAGIEELHLSISHCTEYAVASVVAVRGCPGA